MTAPYCLRSLHACAAAAVAAALPSVPLALFTTPVTAHWSASVRAASRRKAKQAKAATAPTQEGRSQCRDGNGGSPRSRARARAPPSVGRSSIPRRAYPACFARLSNSDSCPPPSSLHAKSCCPPTNLGVSGTGDGTRFGDSEQCKSAQSVAPWLFANRAFRAIFLACWKQILGLQPTLRRHHSISRALKIHCGIERARCEKRSNPATK